MIHIDSKPAKLFFHLQDLKFAIDCPLEFLTLFRSGRHQRETVRGREIADLRTTQVQTRVLPAFTGYS
jgi:hypothetical protein